MVVLAGTSFDLIFDSLGNASNNDVTVTFLRDITVEQGNAITLTRDSAVTSDGNNPSVDTGTAAIGAQGTTQIRSLVSGHYEFDTAVNDWIVESLFNPGSAIVRTELDAVVDSIAPRARAAVNARVVGDDLLIQDASDDLITFSGRGAVLASDNTFTGINNFTQVPRFQGNTFFDIEPRAQRTFIMVADGTFATGDNDIRFDSKYRSNIHITNPFISIQCWRVSDIN